MKADLKSKGTGTHPKIVGKGGATCVHLSASWEKSNSEKQGLERCPELWDAQDSAGQSPQLELLWILCMLAGIIDDLDCNMSLKCKLFKCYLKICCLLFLYYMLIIDSTNQEENQST